MNSNRILITGANGQLGTALSDALIEKHGAEDVIATDIKHIAEEESNFEILNVLDKDKLIQLLGDLKITELYHLAAILSAKGEQDPLGTWEINMQGLFNVLEAARILPLKKVFFPSSIAVFGTTTPENDTPQNACAEPETVYGISKQAGENWCQYYFKRYGVDVRSVRYPGIIGHNALPGGGTTDYAVDIFHKAINGQHFNCFLREDAQLPMMYMDDAMRATLELMAAPSDSLSVRTSYNLAAMSFTPQQIYREIKKHYPGFSISYEPDYRQKIASAWPNSISDARARAEWGWKPQYDLPKMVEEMITQLKKKQPELK